MKTYKITSQDEFTSLMQTKERIYHSLDANLVHVLMLLYELESLAPLSFVQVFLGCTQRDLEFALARVFSPAGLARVWEAALVGDHWPLEHHPDLLAKCLTNTLSYGDAERYFCALQLSKSCVLEFMPFCLTPKKMESLTTRKK